MHRMLEFSRLFHIGVILIFSNTNPDSSDHLLGGIPREQNGDSRYGGLSWNAKRLLSRKEMGTSKLSASAWADLGSMPRPSTNPASRTTASPATTPPTAR